MQWYAAFMTGFAAALAVKLYVVKSETQKKLDQAENDNEILRDTLEDVIETVLAKHPPTSTSAYAYLGINPQLYRNYLRGEGIFRKKYHA